MSSSRTSLKAPVRVQVRWMIRRDMADVLRAETQSFEHPWTEEEFLRCLRQRNCIGMVAEVDDRIVGFMVYELHKNHLHILNFAVLPESRRLRIGSFMMSKLVAKLTNHRRSKLTLAVRERNLAAQIFFRSLNFRAVRVLRNYYEDEEDAFFMEFSQQQPQATEELPERPVNRIANYDDDSSIY